MNKDKKILYIVTFAVFAVLLCLLFIDTKYIRIITALVLIPLALVTRLSVRKRAAASIYKRELLLLVSVIGVIIVVLEQISGVYFGYYENPYFVNIQNLLNYILPLSSIIVTSELIRTTLIAQKNKLVSVITLVSCIFAEVLMTSNIAGISSFNKFMNLVGIAFFPAISENILFHYVSKKFGMLPNITFRAITTLYIYFLPKTAAIPDALTSCIRVVLPILILALIAVLYEKKKKMALEKKNNFSGVAVALTIVIVVSVAMLISCKFRYGAIVIATESMTGEINKGDMIIYERYDGQPIKEGQVIVFLNSKSKIIHRVVEIDTVGGETRYYTKGDANEGRDSGYRTEEDIIGLTDVKVAYIGYPTLWLRQLLKGSN